MATNDRWRGVLDDLGLAFLLLSRIPVPYRVIDASRTAKAAWAWPLVGAGIAGLASGVGAACLWVGLPPSLAAVLMLAVMIVLTGGLHEDGLADTADGLWGGREPARRLEIMRDSRMGAYGILAITLIVLLRVVALAELLEASLWLALPAAAMLSRAGMAGLMAALPPARTDGLSQGTGQPPTLSVAVASALAMGVTVVALGGVAVLAIGLSLGALVGLATLAKAKIGGQTGDILGAAQQITEAIVLLVCVAALT